MSMTTPLILLVLLFQLAFGQASREENTIFQWNELEFDFPNNNDRQQAIRDGNLVPENGTPIDIAVHYKNEVPRFFVTIPRFVTGIPYSLATITDKLAASGQPLLLPYPNNYAAHNPNLNCDSIISVFRVAINECDQMWVVDSGVIGSEQRCPPKLLLFDLNTDKIIHRYTLPNGTYVPIASLLINPILVVRDPPPRGSCRDTMIYIADVTFHGIVVYDYQRGATWRVENKFMYPDPDFGTHTIAGDSFTLMDGIFGMSTYKKNLYFHPLASISEYAVPLSVLDNRTVWDNQDDSLQNQFRSIGIRNSECAAEAFDSRGNLYFVTFNPVELLTWNVNTRYGTKSFRKIPINPSTIEFVSGMKVVQRCTGHEELWMLSNRFQKIGAGTQSSNEINFRVVKLSLGDSPNVNYDLHHKLIFN